jgi:predicted ATPase
LGEYLLEQAQRDEDPAKLLMAYRGFCSTLSHQGELALAQQHFAQAINVYNPEQHHELIQYIGLDPGVVCLSFGMINLWLLGYADQALAWSQEAYKLTQNLDHPFSQAFAHVFTAWLHVFRREARAAKQTAKTALTLGKAHEFAQILAMGKVSHGWAIAELGHPSDGIQQIQQALAAWRATGAEIARPHWLAMLIEQFLRIEQFTAAQEYLDEALAAVEKTGERRGEAELYRLKGELLLQQNGAEAEAETYFRRAIEIAQSQEALAWELRATVSLSRLWQAQGRQPEARPLLAAVYDRFSEGFDTLDLQAARALLRDLG